MLKKDRINTDKAPAAVGPYSQGYRVGDFVFVAGQVALDPATGKLIEGDIKAQTNRVLTSLKAILEAAGSSTASVVKTTVFLQDIKEFRDFNEVYGSFFPDNPPARSMVQVAALPLGAKVEIEAIAIANT